MRINAKYCGLALGLLILVGCNSETVRGPKGTIHGKVTSDGGSLPAGTTIQFFQPKTGLGGSGEIANDGSYKGIGPDGEGFPLGTYNVSISPPGVPGSEDPSVKPPPPPEYPSIPKKYRSAETSGETVDVKEGDNEFNLEMKK